ncbi:MAG: hypothetical protein GW855_11460 [Erythrobacter sp.]|nr:hypothetical protein [Erythrobacter sp.]NCQ62759.1 hypothetical protein [Alphaproteobacteria bacterium]
MIFRTAALALAALAAAAPAQAEEAPAAPENAELAHLLEGRVAGEPTDCVPTRVNARMYIIDKTALVYDTGRTIYVNYTRYPEVLDSNDVILIRENFPRLCKTTHIELRDPFTPSFSNGSIFLTDFIPYKRASNAN